MRHSAAATILVAWLVLGGVQAVGASSSAALDGPAELVSPYQRYDLKLRTFSPAPRCPAGLLLSVRINRGRPLRLVLDSGAEFIVIEAKTARSIGLSAPSELELVGLGSRPAKVGRAETVEAGPVSYRDCRVATVDGRVVEGADGVIPLNFFSDFRLQINLPEKTLELIPYPREDDPAVPPTRGVTKHHPLLVSTVLNGKQSGYVVLDTGAYCSAVSREVARTLGHFPMVPKVRLSAGTGAATGQIVSYPVHFAIAGQDVILSEIVALDLSSLSRHCGVEVIGVLGFPALSNYVLTIDYRNARVKIEPPHGDSARELHRGYNDKTPADLSFH